MKSNPTFLVRLCLFIAFVGIILLHASCARRNINTAYYNGKSGRGSVSAYTSGKQMKTIYIPTHEEINNYVPGRAIYEKGYLQPVIVDGISSTSYRMVSLKRTNNLCCISSSRFSGLRLFRRLKYRLHGDKVSNYSGVPSGLDGNTAGQSFNSDGYNKIYNDRGELWMEGEFRDGELWDGKLYLYNKETKGDLKVVEFWKEGRYRSKGSLKKDGPAQALVANAVMLRADVGSFYERYNSFEENDWVHAGKEPKSTFGIDVDNASYTNFRRFVTQGLLPPKDAIRMEEWLNYFNYELEAPAENDEHPLKITSETGPCPWSPDDELLMIKLQGKKMSREQELSASNLVFLIDVSGSMAGPNKLPLLKESLVELTGKLRPQDKLSIVTYSEDIKVVLDGISGYDKTRITDRITALQTEGGTNGSEGIQKAYQLAAKHFIKGGNNRIVLASDGDWNMGITDKNELKKYVEQKRKSGVFLSVLGFGMGNLNDELMELMADNGNGNYAYIDRRQEAKRMFDTEFAGSMYVIAKDVKLQLEFDSTVVDNYRLIGYENRLLENWQFDVDSIDAGDLGMGQNVVAFYQIHRKKGVVGSIGKVDFRYKQPNADVSNLLIHRSDERVDEVSSDFNFASCVVEFALCLRESEYRGEASMNRAIQRGRENLGNEQNKLSYDKRVEFVGLMEPVVQMWEGYVNQSAVEIPEEMTVSVDTVGTVTQEDESHNLKLNLYPNPARDYVVVEVPQDKCREWGVQIIDLKGSLQQVEHFYSNRQGRVDISNLQPATYIIKVYGQGYHFGYLRLVVN